MRFRDAVRQLKEETDPVAEGVERYVAGEHTEMENVQIRKWGMSATASALMAGITILIFRARSKKDRPPDDNQPAKSNCTTAL